MKKKIFIFFIFLLFSFLLYLLSRYNFLFFHSLIELYCVIIASSIFIVSWNTRSHSDNTSLVFLGISYLFTGIVDLIHLLSYPGMNIFLDYKYYSSQLWIVARYFETFGFLIFALIMIYNIKINYLFVFSGYTLATIVFFIIIFILKLFPDCYIEGIGQTKFKILNEYIIVFTLIIVLLIIIKSKDKYNNQKNFFWYISLSIISVIISELFFTLYFDVYDIFNVIGHILKVISFYLIYKAVIVITLNYPYEILYYKLKENEKKIIEEKQKAEIATQSKSLFLANMSHEIRTPLNVITNISKFLLDTELSETQQDYVNTLNQASEILLNLVNDILDFSKIESGKIEIENLDFDLNETLESIYKILIIKAKQKGLNFTIEKINNIYNYLIGDKNRLQQILLNLLNNSIKFTDKGNVNLILECLDDNDTSILIKFTVKDTGIGISENKLKQLFEPFVQGDNSITRKYGGTGLGLPISKKLIELMNGEISIESKEGLGTKVDFKIKFQKQKKEKNIDIKNNELINYNFKNLKILVAEDNILNQKIDNILFNKLGIEPIFANNGKEAIEILKNNDFDIIFMDLEMPEMDGLEATKIIRNLKLNNNIPIIAMTAHALIEYKNKVFEYGMNDYITKPVDIEKVLTILIKYKDLIEINNKIKENNKINKKIFDKQRFLSRIDNDMNFYKEIIELIIKELPPKTELIYDGIKRSDYETIYKISHNLKGMLLNIDASLLINILKELEVQSKNQNINLIIELFNLLKIESQKLIEILNNEINIKHLEENF